MGEGLEGREVWQRPVQCGWHWRMKDTSEPGKEKWGRCLLVAQEVTQSSLISWESLRQGSQNPAWYVFLWPWFNNRDKKYTGEFTYKSGSVPCYCPKIWRFCNTGPPLPRLENSLVVVSIVHTLEFWHIYTWLASIFYVTCKCHRLYEFASPGFEATKHLGRIGSLKGRHSEAPVEGKTKTCTSSVLKIADIKQHLVCARPCTVLHGLSPSILINPFFRWENWGVKRLSTGYSVFRLHFIKICFARDRS